MKMNEKIIKQTFPEALELIKNKQCPCCSSNINLEEFRDTLSFKEFTISGMCQKCQDKTFN